MRDVSRVPSPGRVGDRANVPERRSSHDRALRYSCLLGWCVQGYWLVWTLFVEAFYVL